MAFKNYMVGVSVTFQGDISVKAKSLSDAVEKAESLVKDHTPDDLAAMIVEDSGSFNDYEKELTGIFS